MPTREHASGRFRNGEMPLGPAAPQLQASYAAISKISSLRLMDYLK